MAGRVYGRRNYANDTDDQDFEEGDVWGILEDKANNSPKKFGKPFKESCLFSSSSSSSRHLSSSTTTPRMIPRSSSSDVAVNGKLHQQSSAPLDIPDWSKIYGKTPKNKKKNGSVNEDNGYFNNDMCYDNNGTNGHYYNNGCGGYGYAYDVHGNGDDMNYANGDADEDEDGMVRPHEYLAKKLARSQISSFSVYEGIGRTLKGRDLSKVRNTILSKTGFLES